MSLDRSLRAGNALVRHRNVLTRAERVARLKEEERWSDEQGIFGMPKVAHRKQSVGKSAGKSEGKEEGTATTAEAPAKGAAPAAAGKGAAPAKGKK